MSTHMLSPGLGALDEPVLLQIVDEATRVLAEVGVVVEHAGAAKLLLAGGATRAGDRLLIDPEMVDRALMSAPAQFTLYDRDGEAALEVGGGALLFVPGSAAVRVYDFEEARPRAATLADCGRFARLTAALPALSLQSTCVVPTDVTDDLADRHRLHQALSHCPKPIVTGTVSPGSFRVMHAMLSAVRGGDDALRERPLAIFDCCPTSPLAWSELTCAALIDCALAGVPAEIISVPMTGATGPITILGALTQHTAENLSGLVIHQLAASGAPVVYGSCASAFDMRNGTNPLGSITTMLINVGTAQIGRHLGLPTHAYMGLSDAKLPDYQAGLESGCGALLAALAGHDVIAGPGMLDFVGCQSLEKLVLDHEAVRLALRGVGGVERRDEVLGLDVIREGVEREQFLKLDHTRRWFRKELDFPGKSIDRQAGESWLAAGGQTASQRAHEEVGRLLQQEGCALAPDLADELDRLVSGA